MEITEIVVAAAGAIMAGVGMFRGADWFKWFKWSMRVGHAMWREAKHLDLQEFFRTDDDTEKAIRALFDAYKKHIEGGEKGNSESS